MKAAANNPVAIIDDDESFCRSSSRWLQALNLEPVTYRSAEEFLDDPGYRRFGCLLVDIQFEGMSGLELQRRLEAENAGLSIVFITAHDDPRAQAQAVRAGCVGYFRKTADGASVLEAIHRALSARAASNAPGPTPPDRDEDGDGER